MILFLSIVFLTIPQINHDDHLNMDPGGSYPGLVPAVWKKPETVFLWGNGGF